MSWSVLCHDQGLTDFCQSFDTKHQAAAYAAQLAQDYRHNPSQWDLAYPWFEVVKGNHRPDPGIDHEQWAAAGCDQW